MEINVLFPGEGGCLSSFIRSHRFSSHASKGKALCDDPRGFAGTRDGVVQAAVASTKFNNTHVYMYITYKKNPFHSTMRTRELLLTYTVRCSFLIKLILRLAGREGHRVLCCTDGRRKMVLIMPKGTFPQTLPTHVCN